MSMIINSIRKYKNIVFFAIILLFFGGLTIANFFPVEVFWMDEAWDTADKDSFVSIEKIQEKLNWKVKYSNQDAFVRAYNWYLEHYEEVKRAGDGVTHRKAWKQGILKLVKKFM